MDAVQVAKVGGGGVGRGDREVEKDVDATVPSQRRILTKFLEVRFHNHFVTVRSGPSLPEPPLRQNPPLPLNLRLDSGLMWTKQSDRS